MVDIFIRNRIVNNVRRLLDEGFQDIKIEVREKGFIIIPTKEKSSEKEGKIK